MLIRVSIINDVICDILDSIFDAHVVVSPSTVQKMSLTATVILLAVDAKAGPPEIHKFFVIVILESDCGLNLRNKIASV